MRLILGLSALILFFALLVRAMPAAWALPLYILFVAITIAYTGWERRRIAERRRQLERQLVEERRDFRQRQEERKKRDKDGTA